jgi:hypothetical protein
VPDDDVGPLLTDSGQQGVEVPRRRRERLVTKRFNFHPVSAALLVILLVIGWTPLDASAQFLLGGGLVFGSDIESLGIQANGNYVINEENGIRLAGDITFYFPDDAPGVDLSLFTINGNGHYIFTTTESLLAYALAGLNLAIVSVETDINVPGFDASFTDTEIGLNLGAGVEYEVNFGYLYGEAKIVVGGFDQLVLGGGIRVPIGN